MNAVTYPTQLTWLITCNHSVFSCGLVSVIGIADAKVCWSKILKVEFAKVKLAKGAKTYLHFR